MCQRVLSTTAMAFPLVLPVQTITSPADLRLRSG
jgi:hypothetical protein